MKSVVLKSERVVLVSPFTTPAQQQQAEATFLFECAEEIMHELIARKFLVVNKGDIELDENGVPVRKVTCRLQVVRS